MERSSTQYIKVFPELNRKGAAAPGKTGNFWIDPPVAAIDSREGADLEFVSVGGELLNVDLTTVHPGAAGTGSPVRIQIPPGATTEGMYVYTILVRWIPPSGRPVWKKARAHSDPRMKISP
ncbi:MAG: hypothetical protein Kow001_00270 [Acidobacteriota bacterium]